MCENNYSSLKTFHLSGKVKFIQISFAQWLSPVGLIHSNVSKRLSTAELFLVKRAPAMMAAVTQEQSRRGHVTSRGEAR